MKLFIPVEWYVMLLLMFRTEAQSQTLLLQNDPVFPEVQI